MDEDARTFDSEKSQKPRKKSKSIWIVILLTILGAAIGHVVGEKIGEATVNAISDNHQVSKIEQFAEQAKTYTPGTLTQDSYRSEYWNLEFRANDPWSMGDEADRQYLSHEALLNAKSSAVASLQSEGASQKIIDAYSDSIYGAVEMYALYTDEYGYCTGEASLTVMQSYGSDIVTEDVFVQGIAENLSVQYNGVTTSEITIGESTYSVISFSAEQNGMICHVKCICMLKGVCSFFLRITYLDGYDEVFTTFLEQLSECS